MQTEAHCVNDDFDDEGDVYEACNIKNLILRRFCKIAKSDY